jgi:hypothetical protein
VSPDINRTWLGMVGPGVSSKGETGAVRADHTDDRPTILQVLGLHDDYTGQGRVLTEVLKPSVTSPALRTRAALRMARLYKQLQAPVGEFGLETPAASTGALAAGDPGDRPWPSALAHRCGRGSPEAGDLDPGVLHLSRRCASNAITPSWEPTSTP